MCKRWSGGCARGGGGVRGDKEVIPPESQTGQSHEWERWGEYHYIKFSERKNNRRRIKQAWDIKIIIGSCILLVVFSCAWIIVCSIHTLYQKTFPLAAIYTFS